MKRTIVMLCVVASGAGWCVAPVQASTTPQPTASLGVRELRLGDTGTDVKTLNWTLRGQYLGTPYHASFVGQTDLAVRTVQRASGLPDTGVVGRTTLKAIAAPMIRERATWYGPGLYGRRTACGAKLGKRTVGVAHRWLPCGTRVVLAHRGRWTRARVIDRGPYAKGLDWDLTARLAQRLGARAIGVAKVKVRVVP